MEPWVPGAVTGTLALIGVVFAGWWQSRREERAAKRASTSPTPPTTQEVWQRLDKMERAFKSSLVLLEEVAEQEHVDTSRLSKKHLMVLSESGYLPVEWEYLVADIKRKAGQ